MPYGSRLYGTFDETSDYDWKIIYLPDIMDMLVGDPIKNIFKQSNTSELKNTSSDTDTEYIAIQTLARDFIKGQAYAIELIFALASFRNSGYSNIDGITIHNSEIFDVVDDLIEKFLTSNVNAMVGYAYHQAQLYSEKGDRLEKLHQFKNFLQQSFGKYQLSVMSKLSDLIDQVEEMADTNLLFDKLLYIQYEPGLNGKQHRSFSLLEKLYPEGIAIGTALDRVSSDINKYGKRANAARDADGHDWKAIAHAVRIVDEAYQLLSEKKVTIPFNKSTVDKLLNIKYGNVPWPDVEKELTGKIDTLKELQEKSTLPTKTTLLDTEFNAWLRSTMIEFYRGYI